MKRTGLFVSLLLFILCVVPALSEAEDPVAVRVGEVAYPRSLVQFAYTSSLDVARAFNGEVSDEDRQAMLDSAIERMIGIGVIENKLKELGQYDFTEEELGTIQYSAQQQYEQTWQELYSVLHEQDESVTEEEVTQWLTDEGYSVDAFCREAMVNERQFRMLSIYCDDVLLTQDDVKRFYMETYVEPEREKYEHDIGRYESEIVATNGEAFFVPEGYRYIKQILLPMPEEVSKALKPCARRVQNALKTAQARYVELAEAAAEAGTMDDLAAQQAAYKEARALLDEQMAAYEEKQRDALPLVKDTTDEIYERYNAGILFEDLMRAYSTDTSRQSADDPGFPFHPDSKNWPEAVHDALSALEKPGDLSEPVVTDAGVHIFRYMGDVPAGVHELTDEEQAAVEEAAVYAAKLSKLQTLVRQWQNDYEIEAHPELIDLE